MHIFLSSLCVPHVQDGYTALHIACIRDRDAIMVGMLIDKGADVNAKTNAGRTALHLVSSVRGRATDTMKFLIRNEEAGINATFQVRICVSVAYLVAFEEIFVTLF